MKFLRRLWSLVVKPRPQIPYRPCEDCPIVLAEAGNVDTTPDDEKEAFTKDSEEISERVRRITRELETKLPRRNHHAQYRSSH